MVKEICVRDVQSEDTAQIIGLMKRLSAQTKFMLREPDEVSDDLVAYEKRIKGMIEDPNMIYLVAVDESDVVGLLIGSRRELIRINHVGDFIIGIDETYWGNGIGTRLMEGLFSWARTNQIKRLTLEVVEGNHKAIQLYKKFGFKEEGKKIADHFIGGNTYLNTIIMGTILDESLLNR